MRRSRNLARAASLLLLLLPSVLPARDLGVAGHLPLPVLDLQRFAGPWHLAAWLPVDFQRKCVREARVEYRAGAGEGFDAHQSCLDEDGRRIGEDAEVVPVPGAPGSLQVRAVAPRWRAWVPFGWTRRWVLAVDPEYQWALVGAPDRDRLWILSRQPRVDRLLLASLVGKAQELGYPVAELVFDAGAPGSEARSVPHALVASTNEPFWQARVDGTGLVLTGPDLPQPRRLQLASRTDALVPGVQAIVARDAQGTVVLRVATGQCQDRMSGAWYPLRAALAVDGAEEVPGCARPAAMPAPGEPR